MKQTTFKKLYITGSVIFVLGLILTPVLVVHIEPYSVLYYISIILQLGVPSLFFFLASSKIYADQENKIVKFLVRSLFFIGNVIVIFAIHVFVNLYFVCKMGIDCI